MKLSAELKWRGQIKDKTFSALSWLDEPQTFYLGTDCSSDSLQIGNLAVYMMARRLRKHGWKAVLLVGGATSLIGDPGGKDEERQLKPREEIIKNVKAIESQVKQLFSGMDFTLVDNYDWFKDIGYLEFLRDIGKHYSMTELLQRDFIQSRIGKDGTGISYAEFSYSLIQGYDYWHLYKKQQVTLQIGGSDQWGNMLSGVPLIRKKENKEVHALSMPLVINSATGKKFGKSEDGAVWLDANKTSVYKFYQFWLNVDDAGVEDYLKIYTELEKDEIEAVMKQFHEHRGGRHAQKTLAYEVTRLVHGKERADAILRVTDILFASHDYEKLTTQDFEMLAEELPTTTVAATAAIVPVLVTGRLASSNTEARRFLSEGAIYINDKATSADKIDFDSADFTRGCAIVRRGKNTQMLVKLK